MAEMEGIEQMGEVEEKKIEEHEEEGEEEEGEVTEQVSYEVNKHVTLFQSDLCVIYTFLHSAGTPWYSACDEVEIKQIVGHPLLELEDDIYQNLDLGKVIKCLYNNDDDFTRRVKVPAEKHQKLWVAWIPQLQKKYMNMCQKDDKLAKQRDEERAAQQAAERVASLPRPEKRRRIHPSIAAVMTVSSSQSQGDQGRAESGWDSKWDADANEEAC